MAGDNRTDAERAEQRAAREAREAAKGKAKADKAKKPADKAADPVLDGAEMLTVRGEPIKVTDEEFAVMLEKAGGFKSRVAAQLGVSTSAICHRIKRSKYLTETCLTIEERILDLAEMSLIKAAQNGEPWAVQFILKCKGRKRGWIERQDITLGGDADSLPPPFVFEVHDAAYIEAERKRQKREFAEIVDAAVVELKPGGAHADPDASRGGKGEEVAETWGATAQPLALGQGNGAEFQAVGAETAPETAVPRPDEAGGAITQPKEETPQGAVSAPVAGNGEKSKAAEKPEEAPKPPKPEPKPRAPRTPSEAARMRREKEMREKAANGGGGGAQAEAARTRPSFARPMPGAARRGMRGGGIF